eukprot:c45744_g1_i1.p1 GENE.c45744_g1_i1~~c45744_g1_i1.p1  ORF type:complete len:332 (+),score=60.42 c45744_g1_i1:82-996(+)
MADSEEPMDAAPGPATTTGLPAYTGWMTKQGGSRKTWRRRWFVLQNHTLSYYKDNTSASPLGIISLQGCSVSKADSQKKANCFQIYHPVRRTFYMYPATAVEQEEWLESIKAQIPKQDGSNTYNIVMLGGGGVGKSALTLQFVNNVFLVDYEPTIEDSFMKQLTVDDESCRVSILDTAGQEEYATITDQYIDVGQGFLIVFDLTNADSIHDANRIHGKVLRSHEGKRKLPVVLVGNKADMVNNRVITEADAKAAAASLACAYYETSALTRQNVELVFHEVVRLIRTNESGGLGDSGKDKKCAVM